MGAASSQVLQDSFYVSACFVGAVAAFLTVVQLP